MRAGSQNKQDLKQLSQAFLYFNTPIQAAVSQSQFQQHLLMLEKTPVDLLKKYNMEISITERYYEVVNKYSQLNLEEHILLRLIQLMEKLLYGQSILQQHLIVVVWASINLLKKCTPETDNKQKIKQILKLLRSLVINLVSRDSFKAQTIYPQVSVITIRYITSSHVVSHTIFGSSLAILGALLIKIYSNSNQEEISILSLQTQDKQSDSKQFDKQCLPRLEQLIKTLVKKLQNLELIYHQSVSQFVKQIWIIQTQHTSMLGPLAVLAHVTGNSSLYTNLTQIKVKLAHSAITHEFISALNRSQSSTVQHTLNLKQMEKLATQLRPTPEQVQYILLKFTNSLYLIHNSKSLIVPHAAVSQSIHLVQIEGTHSFNNYPVAISSLIEAFNFETEKLLISKMPYAETSLSNVGLLRKIAENMPSQVKNQMLEKLVQSISLQQNQYMVDMSLTKFYQFLTKVVLIYWLTRQPTFQFESATALSLFQTLSNCQTIRVLKPSFQQEQMLIGLTLLICYTCYRGLVNLGSIRKLKLRIVLLQMVINNVHEQSYILKCATYYILLAESAPNSVSNMLHNLQPTLINRNLNNVNFIISLVKFGNLSAAQSQDIAQKFMRYYDSEQLIKLLLPKLTTATIRKCLLSAASTRGKWIHMLLGNTKLLYSRSIQEAESLDVKAASFYMGDGPNVKITNALGVVLLELGQKWEHALRTQSPYRDPAILLLLQLVTLDNQIVFFKLRFLSVIDCLIKILLQPQMNAADLTQFASERTRYRIYIILSKICETNYKAYLSQTSQNYSKVRAQLISLLQNIRNRHKKYQLQYLMASGNQQAAEMYDYSDTIMTKISQALDASNTNQIPKNQEQFI